MGFCVSRTKSSPYLSRREKDNEHCEDQQHRSLAIADVKHYTRCLWKTFCLAALCPLSQRSGNSLMYKRESHVDGV